MSIIDKEKQIEVKEQIKMDEKMEENKKINIKDESFSSAKELIKKLLQIKLNNPLIKLESNSSNHLTSLKNSSKSFNEFSKIINDLIKNVEETKQKKMKEKSSRFQRTERKTLTINSRSKTISNIIKFRSKATLTIVGNNKKKINNNNTKVFRKMNTNIHKLGNKTMTTFRVNDNESIEDNMSQRNYKFQKYASSTAQNFRKKNNKTGTETPKVKAIEKRKNRYIDKAFNQNERNSVSELYINRINTSKIIENVNVKDMLSKTHILNQLTDIDEDIEKNISNNMTKKNPKHLKGVLNRNDTKNAKGKINNQLNKKDEKNNKNHFNKAQIKNKKKESKESQVENIVKIVGDVNQNIQNIDKMLTESKSKKNIINVKEGNNKKNKIMQKVKSSQLLVNAIKDVNIHKKEDNKNKNEIQKISKEKKENKNQNIIENEEKNKSDTKEIKDNIDNIKKNATATTATKEENDNNNLLKNIDINEKEKKEMEKNININYNIFKIFEKINISKLRRNKSANNITKNNSDIKYNRSSKDLQKIPDIKEIKEKPQIKEKKDIDKKNEALNKSVKISNKFQKINLIRNKMREKVDKINKQKKIDEKKKLNESYKSINDEEKKDKKEQIIIDSNNKNLIINKRDKENIKNINTNNNKFLNKTPKILMKNRFNIDVVIRRVKSVYKAKNKNLLI